MELSLTRFREKHGAFYYDSGKGSDGRRKWLHLGRDRDKALGRYAKLVGADASEAKELESHLKKIYRAAKRRAKVANIEFSLSEPEYREIVHASGMRCQLTGIPFSLSWSAGSKHRRPYVPSLDRIDSTKPYTKANCRLVLCAVNYALNEWGETVFRKIAAAMVDMG